MSELVRYFKSALPRPGQWIVALLATPCERYFLCYIKTFGKITHLVPRLFVTHS